MNIDTSIVTDTSRSVTAAGVSAYRDAIASHIDSDWGQHTQLNLAAGTNYVPPSTWSIINLTGGFAKKLRMQVTRKVSGTAQSQVFVVPAMVQSGVFPSSGNAPVILRTPTAVTIRAGELVQLSVYAASATPMIYQWQKNTQDILGATSDTFSIPSAALSDQAMYRVKVTNSVDSVTSLAVQVKITS